MQNQHFTIDHIGIAVQNLEDALRFYQNILQIPVVQKTEVASEQVRVAFLQTGEAHIELLEPASEISSIATFLQKKGEGIHHLCIEVDHLDEILEHCKEQNVQVLSGYPKIGAKGNRIAFIHPKSSNGVLLELSERKRKTP